MKLFGKDRRTELEKERDEAIEELRGMAWKETGYDAQGYPLPNPYNEQLKRIERLTELIGDRKARVSLDAALGVAGNILGIALILHHEKLNVVATKALGFVLRTRV